MYPTYQQRSKIVDPWASSLQNELRVPCTAQYQNLDDPYPVSTCSAPSTPGTFDSTTYGDVISMPSNDYFQPDEIFQLDQPIRNYNGTTTVPCTNGMSPESSRSLLDLDSIQRTYETTKVDTTWMTDIKYESCDDTSSLTSTSSQFDEAYYNFQQQQQQHQPQPQQAYYSSGSSYDSRNNFFDHCENVSSGGTSYSVYNTESHDMEFNGKNENYTNYTNCNQWNNGGHHQEFFDQQSYGMPQEFSSLELASASVYSHQHQLTYASA